MKYTYVFLLVIYPVIAFHSGNYNNKTHCYYRKQNNLNNLQQLGSGRLNVYNIRAGQCNLQPLKAEPEMIAKTVAAVGTGIFVIYSLISNFRQRKAEKKRIQRELTHLDRMKQEYIRTGIDPDVKMLR